MKSKILILLFTAITAMPLVSCEKFLEEKMYSEVNTEKIFKNYSEAEMSVKNCYSVLHDGLYGWLLQTLNSVGTDEMIDRAPQSSRTRLSNYSLTAGDKNIQSVWTNLYKGIYRCNDTYHKIGKMAGDAISEEGKLKLQAETTFLRSLFYFNLVQMWGGVRLNIVEPSFNEVVRTDVKRASVAEVYEQIVEDIEFAKSYLAETAPQQGRASLYAAYGLAAKIYLTMASGSQFGVAGYESFDPATYYRLAKENAKAVMDYADQTGLVGLMENYRDIFSVDHKYNKENLFEVSFVVGGTGSTYPQKGGPMAGGNNNPWYFMKSALTGGGDLRPTAYLALHIYGHTDETTFDQTNGNVTKIRSEDTRFIHNIAHWKIGAKYVYSGNIDADIPELMNATNSTIEWTIAKFAMKTPDQSTFGRFNRPVNFPLIRYADILLIYGEAAGMLNLGDATAYDAINKVRARARLDNAQVPEYLADWSAANFASVDDFVDAVLDERMRELCFEGHRRPDLLRTGRLFSTINRMAYTDRNYSDPAKPDTDFTEVRARMVEGDITYTMYETNLLPYHVLLPIPQYEMNIIRNADYPQNPGWKTADIEDDTPTEEEE